MDDDGFTLVGARGRSGKPSASKSVSVADALKANSASASFKIDAATHSQQCCSAHSGVDASSTPSVPTSRKARRQKRADDPAETISKQIADCVTRLQMHTSMQSVLLSSLDAFLQPQFAIVAPHQDIVVNVCALGLGPLRYSNGRAQLAFTDTIAKYIHEILQRKNAGVDVSVNKIAFDPIFDELDRQVLARLSYEMTFVNDGKLIPRINDQERVIPLIMIMPHCTEDLYDNFLRENSKNNVLQHTLLIGNSLSFYARKPLIGLQAGIASASNDVPSEAERGDNIAEFGLIDAVDDLSAATGASRDASTTERLRVAETKISVAALANTQDDDLFRALDNLR
jgi:hypothetical protein